MDSKTNEITAIDGRLDFIDVRGTISTIDIIGSQKSIAKKIDDEGGDYVLAFKASRNLLRQSNTISNKHMTKS